MTKRSYSCLQINFCEFYHPQNIVTNDLSFIKSTYTFSLQKYVIFSPNLLHPIECSWESLTEYIKGFMPSLYKLSSFERLTIENLKVKTPINDIHRVSFAPSVSFIYLLYLIDVSENKTFSVIKKRKQANKSISR